LQNFYLLYISKSTNKQRDFIYGSNRYNGDTPRMMTSVTMHYFL